MLRIYSCNECTGPLHFYSSRLQRGVNEKLLPKNPILYILRIHDLMIVHVLWTFFYKAVTASRRWSRRFYGVLEAWSCIPMDFYGRLMAVWLRAHDVPRFPPCTHCVLKALTECISVLKKFMWHSDIRKDSERSLGKLNRLIIASILQLYALLERANVAIYT